MSKARTHLLASDRIRTPDRTIERGEAAGTLPKKVLADLAEIGAVVRVPVSVSGAAALSEWQAQRAQTPADHERLIAAQSIHATRPEPEPDDKDD